jgi:hypothetical protein
MGTNYAAAAQMALNHTLNALPLGAADRASDLFSFKVFGLIPALLVNRSFKVLGDCIDSVTGQKSSSNDDFFKAAFYAERYGCGNCYEHAAVAYTWLYRNGVRPIAVLGRTNHAFVILGYGRSSLTDPQGWPVEAWICDPWKKIVYPAQQYWSHEREAPLPYAFAS